MIRDIQLVKVHGFEDKSVLAIDETLPVFAYISNEKFVIGCGFMYGLCSFGWKPTLKRPLRTLFWGSLFWAPLCAFGTSYICSMMPRKAIGVLPVLFASSIIYQNFYKKSKRIDDDDE